MKVLTGSPNGLVPNNAAKMLSRIDGYSLSFSAARRENTKELRGVQSIMETLFIPQTILWLKLFESTFKSYNHTSL